MTFEFTKSNLLIVKKINQIIESRQKYKKELYLSLLKEKVIQSKKYYFYMIFWIFIGILFLGKLGSMLLPLMLLFPFGQNVSEVNKEIKLAAGNVCFYKKILSQYEFDILNELLEYNKKKFEYLSSDELENIILEKLSKKTKLTYHEFSLLLDSDLGSGYDMKTFHYKKIIHNFFIDKDLLTIMFQDNSSNEIEIKLKSFLIDNHYIQNYIISKSYPFLFLKFNYNTEILNKYICYLCEEFKIPDELFSIFEVIYENYILDKVLNILYGNVKNEEETKLYNIIQNNLIFKSYVMKKIKDEFNNIDISESFKYNDYLLDIEYKTIIKKILNSFYLNELVKIAFSRIAINSANEKLIFNYINHLDSEKLIYFKKEIVNIVLNKKNIEDIKGVEIDFFNLADNLNVDKESLFILKEKFNQNNLIKLEDLKDIKIISI